MSQAILEQLRRDHAFKPKMGPGELAIAHVRAAEAGLPHPVDELVLNAMIGAEEAFVILLGPPGTGKSSLIASTVAAAAATEGVPKPLPIIVPAAGHKEPITSKLLVRGVAQQIGYELRGLLKPAELVRLSQALATSITKTRQSSGGFGIGGGAYGFSGHISGQFAKDMLALTTDGPWDGGGPKDTLMRLRDTAYAHDLRLVVIFDDADLWTAGDHDADTAAKQFFSALRGLVDCPEVTFVVAIQTHWAKANDSDKTTTKAAKAEYAALADVVATRLKVPLPANEEQAKALIAAIIDRRVEITLPDVTVPEGGWCAALFTNDAVKMLGNRCRKISARQAINDIRDVFDLYEDLPDQIDSADLVAAIT